MGVSSAASQCRAPAQVCLHGVLANETSRAKHSHIHSSQRQTAAQVDGCSLHRRKDLEFNLTPGLAGGDAEHGDEGAVEDGEVFGVDDAVEGHPHDRVCAPNSPRGSHRRIHRRREADAYTGRAAPAPAVLMHASAYLFICGRRKGAGHGAQQKIGGEAAGAQAQRSGQRVCAR